MRAHDNNLHSADVVASFESQDDADEALLQLRLSGFSDDQIGYFAQHPTRGLTEILTHDRSFSGSVIGGLVGAALGVGLARALNLWAWRMDAPDIYGLSITLGTFMALFVGFIGWGIGIGVHRRAVDPPTVDESAGPFVIAVHAGEARTRAWDAIHSRGGHQLHPAMG